MPTAPSAGGQIRTFTNAPQLRPLSIGEIIDVAIKIYRSNAASLLKAVALVVVPVQILGAFIQTSVVPDPQEITPFDPTQTPFDPTVTPVTPGFDSSAIWTFVGGIVLTALLNWLAAQLATAASLRAVSEAYLGEKSDWRQSLEYAFSRFGPLLLISILSAIGVGFGYLLCIIPGIWLSISWSVAIPALLIEDLRGTSALSRSFQLVKGRWWSVAGAVVLGQIIASILGAVFGFAFGALAFMDDSPFVTFISSAVSTAISQTLVTPFLAAMIAIIYFDLRVRKEGFDLELLAQQVGGTAVPQTTPSGSAEQSYAPPTPGVAGATPAAPPARPERPRPRVTRPSVSAPGRPSAPGTSSAPDGPAAPEPPPGTDEPFGGPPPPGDSPDIAPPPPGRPAPRRRPVRRGFETPPDEAPQPDGSEETGEPFDDDR